MLKPLHGPKPEFLNGVFRPCHQSPDFVKWALFLIPHSDHRLVIGGQPLDRLLQFLVILRLDQLPAGGERVGREFDGRLLGRVALTPSRFPD